VAATCSRQLSSSDIFRVSSDADFVTGLPAEEGFTGRTASVEELLAVVCPDSTSVGTVLVSTLAGMAGVGKSALAIHVGHRALAQNWFPGGVLFLDMHGYDPALRIDAHTAQGSFLRGLGVPGERIPDERGARQLVYQTALANRARTGQRVLVIVDNASSIDQVTPLRPGHPEHRMLVTSRHPIPLGNARRMELDVLPVNESVQMVNAVLRAANTADDRITTHEDDANLLVELCGGLPIALRITAELLVALPQRSVAEQNEIYADQQTRLREMSFSGSIATRITFDQSYEMLGDKHKRLFWLLAVHPGTYVSRYAATALADRPAAEVRRLLDDLEQACLIRPAPARGGYRFHDLIHLYARSHAELHDHHAERVAGTRRLLDHYLNYALAADIHLNPRRGSATSGSIFQTRNTALLWLDSEIPNLVPAVRLAGETSHAYELPLALFFYYSLRKQLDDWIETHQLGLLAARGCHDQSAEAKLLNNLGVAYHELRQYELAVECLLQARTLYQRLGDRYGEARTYNGLGDTYTVMGRYTEGIPELQRAYELRIEIDDVAGQGRTLGNLGRAYVGLERFDEAIDYLTRALQISTRQEDLFAEGRTREAFGRAYLATGRRSLAVTHFLRAIDIHQAQTDRYSEGTALRGLALTYGAQGYRAEARFTLLLARSAFEEVNAIEDAQRVDRLLGQE
jgi:tetratricopeptide (TPR) repeat protein